MKSAPDKAAEIIANRTGGMVPKVGIVLGSGLSTFADSIADPTIINYSDLPNFPLPSVTGHSGELFLGNVNKTLVACLKGRSHPYENGVEAMVTPVRTLKRIGCEVLLITNAAGSLVSEWSPGTLMIISDHINLQPGNPLVGLNADDFGPRFPDLSDAYDEKLRTVLRQCAKSNNLTVEEGVYIACLGPSFETPAEIKAFQTLGANAVGMSTVAEVIVARHCGLRVAAISVLTNLAAGLTAMPLSHEGTLATAGAAAQNLRSLLLSFLAHPDL